MFYKVGENQFSKFQGDRERDRDREKNCSVHTTEEYQLSSTSNICTLLTEF